MSDGVSAVDLVAALAAIREHVDAVALGEPVDGTVSDRWRAVEALQETAKTISLARGKIETALREDLGNGDHPLDDGTVLHVGARRTVPGGTRTRCGSELTRYALQLTEDGEIRASAPEAVAAIWEVADVAVGRTKVLFEALEGDLDEYCREEWKPNIERRPL
jgi:hypothetical protein